MMQLLTAGGLTPITDSIRTADEDNPRGYFELEDVKSSQDWIEGADGKVVKLISQLLLGLPIGPRYKVIFMRRRLEEVLASQKKMLARRGEPVGATDEEMSEMFAAHVEEVEAFIRGREDISALFVSYKRLVEEPEPQVERIRNFLGQDTGAPLELVKMVGAIDPTLYRNRGTQGADQGAEQSDDQSDDQSNDQCDDQSDVQ